jgi:hypothetical protein
MELLDKNVERLKDVWAGEDDRQNAKLVILEAITRGTDITVKQADDILSALDDILVVHNSSNPIKRDTAL